MSQVLQEFCDRDNFGDVHQPVVLASTHGAEPKDRCKRWSKSEGRYIQIDRPSAQLVGSKTGGLRLEEKPKKDQMDQLMYKTDLADHLLLAAEENEEDGIEELPIPATKRKKKTPLPSDAKLPTGVKHMPQLVHNSTTRHRCRLQGCKSTNAHPSPDEIIELASDVSKVSQDLSEVKKLLESHLVKSEKIINAIEIVPTSTVNGEKIWGSFLLKNHQRIGQVSKAVEPYDVVVKVQLSELEGKIYIMQKKFNNEIKNIWKEVLKTSMMVVTSSKTCIEL
ncbi:hypothetical protein J6590_095024 [Homalodisca vitripennis]|nr:hypothetical protein J6590_095024 [Homalodisca vitripennis]